MPTVPENSTPSLHMHLKLQVKKRRKKMSLSHAHMSSWFLTENLPLHRVMCVRHINNKLQENPGIPDFWGLALAVGRQGQQAALKRSINEISTTIFALVSLHPLWKEVTTTATFGCQFSKSPKGNQLDSHPALNYWRVSCCIIEACWLCL